MNTHTTAEQIRDTLKGTLFMLGAQNLVSSNNSLSFKIRGSKKYTHIKIELTIEDLFKVTFYKIRKFTITSTETFDSIYVDMLHELIRRETGLETRLPTVMVFRL